MSCEHWSDRLDAYVDGASTREELAAVEDHLRDCPVCAREALGRMQLKRATQFAAQRFTPSPEFRLRVQNSIRRDIDRKPLWSLAWRPGLLALTATLLVIAASSLVWTQHVRRQQALAELIDLHVATLASANPVDVVSTDRHTVKPWYQGRIPFSFNLPEFQNTGYTLIGGRLVYFHQQPGAQLLVALRQHKISVLIFQETPELARAFAGPSSVEHRNSFNIDTWTSQDLRFIIVGDAEPAALTKLAQLLKQANS